MIYLKTAASIGAGLCLLAACASTSQKAPMTEDMSSDTQVSTDVEAPIPSAPTAPDVMEVEPAPQNDLTSESLLYNAMTQWEMQGFVDAARAADLAGLLDGETVYTVFAPNSDALARVGDDVNADMLSAHIVEGAYSAADIKTALESGGGLSLTSLAGTPVKFYLLSDTVRVSGPDGVLANLVGEERAASNGVLHQVSASIAP